MQIIRQAGVVNTRFGPIYSFPVFQGMTRIERAEEYPLGMTKKIVGRDAKGNPIFQPWYQVNDHYEARDSKGTIVGSTPKGDVRAVFALASETGIWAPYNNLYTSHKGEVFVLDGNPDSDEPGHWYRGYPYLNSDGEPIGVDGKALMAPAPDLTTLGQSTPFFAGGDTPEMFIKMRGQTRVEGVNVNPTMEGAHGSRSVWLAWIGTLLRLAVRARKVAEKPKKTGNLEKDFQEAYDFEEDIGVEEVSIKLVDTITDVGQRVLSWGGEIKPPSPGLVAKIEPFLKNGVGALLALRQLPDKPTAGSDPIANLENLVNHRERWRDFIREIDFSEQAAQVAQLLFENPPDLKQLLPGK